jgi:hypothetical protein
VFALYGQDIVARVVMYEKVQETKAWRSMWKALVLTRMTSLALTMLMLMTYGPHLSPHLSSLTPILNRDVMMSGTREHTEGERDNRGGNIVLNEGKGNFTTVSHRVIITGLYI